MALCFAYRSDSATQARYAKAWRAIRRFKSASAVPLTTTGIAGVFGGQYLDVTTAPQIGAAALANTPVGTTAITVLLRLIPRSTGNPAANKSILGWGSPAARTDGWAGYGFHITNASKMQWGAGTPANGTVYANDDTFANAFTFVANQPTDIWFRWNGSAAANQVEVWQAQNGVAPTLVSSMTARAALSAPQLLDSMGLQINGDIVEGTNYNDAFHINEICIWDSFENPTDYGARTDFIPCSVYEGYAAPSASQIVSGQTVLGVAGNQVVPAASDTRHGTSVGTGTGSLRVPARADVRKDVLVDNTTGLASIPTAAQTELGVAVEQTTGLLVKALAVTTKHGVTANDGPGEYRGADLNDVVPPEQVAKDYEYLADGEEYVGELENVTNIIDGGVATSEEFEGVAIGDE